MDKYIKDIDYLRDKVLKNNKISLNEACWVLYAEMSILSEKWEAFRIWAKNNSLNKKMIWPIWKGVFFAFEEIYNDSRFKNKI